MADRIACRRDGPGQRSVADDTTAGGMEHQGGEAPGKDAGDQQREGGGRLGDRPSRAGRGDQRDGGQPDARPPQEAEQEPAPDRGGEAPRLEAIQRPVDSTAARVQHEEGEPPDNRRIDPQRLGPIEAALAGKDDGHGQADQQAGARPEARI